ncbi:YciI family protein [Jatrophihabitans sp. YIM 134969]
MPRYLALIHDDNTAWNEPGAYERGLEWHNRFGAERKAQIHSGEALQSESTMVRSDGEGGHLVTDGPFSEAKETLGGYYLYTAADRDEAVEIAKEVPVLRGWIEVREILEFD